MNWNIVSLLFRCCCLLGLTFQILELSIIFFRYQTSTKIMYEIREFEEYQTLFFCPSIVDLLNRSRHKEYGIYPYRPMDLKEVGNELSQLTIKNMFEWTPSASSFIDRCWIREFKNNQEFKYPTYRNHDECKKVFKTTKSVMGESICYTVSPPEGISFSVPDISGYLTHANEAYTIHIGREFERKLWVIRVMSQPSSYNPLYSRMFVARFTRFANQKVSVYGQSTEIERLPPPYDTMCLESHDRETCNEACWTKELLTVNRVPWTSILSEKTYSTSQMNMLTYKDYFNSTIRQFANETDKKCKLHCRSRTECRTQFSRTTLVVQPEGGFYFKSMLPNGPQVSIVSLSLLSLVEYLVQLGSCFGTWFGLSVISLNPSNWSMFKKLRVACNCRGRSIAPRLRPSLQRT